MENPQRTTGGEEVSLSLRLRVMRTLDFLPGTEKQHINKMFSFAGTDFKKLTLNALKEVLFPIHKCTHN